ncbi:MAG: class A beta-lactamase [Sphingomonadales bacterium]|nr:class A beta-lactamase [Sphingomonadales bacterium]MBD3772034.1 class A beta-lactamase [Paracoccaceae bacterium]
MIDRRSLIVGGAALAASACVPLDPSPTGRLAAKLRLIEVGSGGDLGVAFLNPAQRLALGHRQDEAFAMCSTFKTSLAALVLSLEQAGKLDLSQVIRWSEADLLSYAPFAKERLASGASLRELARAAQVLSDNTAANLLLERVGGPAGVTAYWRSLGNAVSRLDRTEPQLNFVPPGEIRDTTSPAAMAGTLANILFGDALDSARQAELRGWMRETQTGLSRVRAGLPPDWEVGDKTGSSGDWPAMPYARGDIGYVVSPMGDPVLFAVYHRASRDNPPKAEVVDAAFATVGQVLSDWIDTTYRVIVA